MSNTVRLPVRTASKKQSIWRDLKEETLRKHMVALEKASSEVPEDPKVHSLALWQQQHHRPNDTIRVLPLVIEQRIADDFAFLAASEDNVKAVSAVALEQRNDGQGMLVRIAANDHLPVQTAEALRGIFDELGECASRSW